MTPTRSRSTRSITRRLTHSWRRSPDARSRSTAGISSGSVARIRAPWVAGTISASSSIRGRSSATSPRTALMAELTRIRPTRSRANRADDVCASREPPMRASSRRMTRIERGAAVSSATRTSRAGETSPNVSTKRDLPIWRRSPCCNARSSAGSPLTNVGLPRSKSRTTICCPFHARMQCRGETVASASAMLLLRSHPMLVSD